MAARVNLKADQGATWNETAWEVQWQDADSQPIDVSAYTGRLQIRTHHAAEAALLDIATENGTLVLTADGRIYPQVSQLVTDQLPPGEWVYDLELTSPEQVVTRLIEGTFEITPQVTR